MRCVLARPGNLLQSLEVDLPMTTSNTTSTDQCHPATIGTGQPIDHLPLNQLLYDRLRQRFGSVLIARQGEALTGCLMDLGQGKPRFQVSNPGEYLRIACPFCFDTRHRLWINHRWGVGPDGVPGERLWWMAICYNENCLDKPENRKALRTAIYGGVGRELHPSRVRIRRGAMTMSSLGTAEWPGRCLRVDQLRPEHHAVQYLLGRGFDPVRLAEAYDVAFCQEAPSDFPVAGNRLIVPIMMRGKMASWQARHVGDIDWKSTGIPKYVNCSGTNKRLMLYGFDDAVTLPFCIVVEGVSDVWAVGTGAVALLGKSMSQQQFDLIRSCWKAAVILLDDDAVQAAEDLHRRLGQVMPVVRVALPPGLDPASIDHTHLWDLIYQASTEQGVDLEALADQQ